jgi:acetylornithine deacetylase
LTTPPLARSTSSAELLARLISFDTTSRHTNVPLVEFAESYLNGLGITTQRADLETGQDQPDRHDRTGAGRRHRAVRTYRRRAGGRAGLAQRPVQRRHPRRQDVRPRCVRHEGLSGLLPGAAPVFRQADLARPVHLVFSCDEEVTCEGVLPAIRRFGVGLPKPSVCIVGEPTHDGSGDGPEGLPGLCNHVHRRGNTFVGSSRRFQCPVRGSPVYGGNGKAGG